MVACSASEELQLQTDPKVVARFAEEREDAHWRFRTFLKGIEMEREALDAIVYRHIAESNALCEMITIYFAKIALISFR